MKQKFFKNENTIFLSFAVYVIRRLTIFTTWHIYLQIYQIVRIDLFTRVVFKRKMLEITLFLS